ncbi:hypothetical protein QBC38DRAFT_523461 [Podospora fimiseda]|uniref:MACPF domain-containing protein n=1 Tax=Podospora fimiseda TaxID=252190 RepID=A0AAN7BSJ1_9PEZI|nr:hypothetical protein QBC38DRAFT_523461 [Podospora fimiseda]
MVASTTRVSQTIREALQATLPTAPEQLLTVQVPGVSIDCNPEGPYWWNPKEHAETPHRVKVNEARLVDGMVPLSKLMLGPTGKSVARSYAAALDMLIPEDAPIDTPTDVGVGGHKTQAAERYLMAMKYLTSLAPNSTKTVIDVYVEKQEAWSVAMKEWDRAKQDAYNSAKQQYPNDVKMQQWAYDEWNQANFRNYKTRAQAKYMDWIVNGCKYKVDYYFGIVDVSSAMKRVESSKEAARNLVVIDPDGTTEWQEVHLEPPNWADECLIKINSWNANKNKLSRKDYESEIKRMKRLLLSYKGLETSLGGPLAADKPAETEKGDANGSPPTGDKNSDETKEEKELRVAYQKLYEAQNNKKTTPQALKEAQIAVQTALDAHGTASLKKNKHNVEYMATKSKNEKLGWIANMIQDTQEQINLLQQGLDSYNKSSIATPAVQDVEKQSTDSGEVVKVNYSEADDRWADPKFNLTRNNVAVAAPSPQDSKPNKWTKISVNVSASNQESDKASSSSASSASFSARFGFFSASGGVSYSQASSKASQSAANCNVDISFEALMVTINRAWLHGELFADQELNVAPDVKLSPGWSALKKFIDAKSTDELVKYAYFPSYPTAFIIASNVEMEFRGDTTHLEEAIESSSFNANLKVSYGPFKLSSSHKQDKSSAKAKMETTATGTRISLEAPCIIGWVTTMLPQLPRPKDENNSLVQPFV